jgi:hypothetical protein
MSKKTFKHIKTKERFIERANEKHGNKYDYSLVDFPPRGLGTSYNGQKTRKLPDYNAQAYIKIVCPLHGEFEQQARKHLEGSGCKHCAQQRNTEARIGSRGEADYTTANKWKSDGNTVTLSYTPSDKIERQVLLDECDLEILKYAKWYTTGHQKSRKNKTNYAASRRNKRTDKEGFKWLGTHLPMHRLIMSRVLGRELVRGELVDHINGNGLDNRRCNLRLATPAQNLYNSKKDPNRWTSYYKGVCWIKEKQRWRAYIGSAKMKSNPRVYLGDYDCEEEAARAYDKAAKARYGKFAKLNFPEENNEPWFITHNEPGKTRKIIIESKKHGQHIALIDEEDWEKVSQHHWFLQNNGKGVLYVGARIPHPDGGYRITPSDGARRARKKTILLHRVIMNPSPGYVVDHKNHNTLDNRKANLRVCTPLENARNIRGKKNSACKYKGVHKSGKYTWTAQIRATEEAKTKCIATCPSPEEAALAYDAEAIKRHGEFACLNFPDGPSQEVLDLVEEGRRRAEAQKHQKWGHYEGQFRGVNATKCRTRWRARHRGELLGRYDTPEEAARAYDERVIELYGEYAYLNFPEEHNESE